MSKKLYPGQRPPNWTSPDGSKPKKMSRLKIALIVVGACVWLGIVAAAMLSNDRSGARDDVLSANSSSPGAASVAKEPKTEPVVRSTPKKPSTADRLDFQIASKMKLEEALRDPDSAQYDGVRAHLISKPGEHVNYAFCGTVNSKNAFGGYSGRQRFIANPLIVVVEQGTPDFGQIWDIYCGPDTDEGEVWF